MCSVLVRQLLKMFNGKGDCCVAPLKPHTHKHAHYYVLSEEQSQSLSPPLQFSLNKGEQMQAAARLPSCVHVNVYQMWMCDLLCTYLLLAILLTRIFFLPLSTTRLIYNNITMCARLHSVLSTFLPRAKVRKCNASELLLCHASVLISVWFDLSCVSVCQLQPLPRACFVSYVAHINIFACIFCRTGVRVLHSGSPND